MSAATQDSPEVESALAEREDEVWSTRRVVAFVIVVCSAFWLAVGAIVVWLVRAL